MSFLKSLKGLADDFKDLMGDKDKDKIKDKKQAEQQKPVGGVGTDRGASDGYYHQQTTHGDSSQQYGQPTQYGQQQAHGQQQFQQGPPGQSYGVPQSFGGPPGPQLPPGWIQQWDQNSQRYYYLEQATGRSQWEPPMMHGDQSRGYGGAAQGYGAPMGAPQVHDQSYGQGYPAPEKQKNNKNGMLAAGAGGLLVGGLAGAALSGDSSDDEHHTSGAPSGYGAAPASYGASYGAPPAGYGAPPPTDPEALEHNSNVSSSQRSSLESAREDYEEAQRKAADSDASSSDIEEAREAREEYQEEIQSAEEDAYDD